MLPVGCYQCLKLVIRGCTFGDNIFSVQFCECLKRVLPGTQSKTLYTYSFVIPKGFEALVQSLRKRWLIGFDRQKIVCTFVA